MRTTASMVGKTFGYLEVLSISPNRTTQGKPRLLCRCTRCGREKEIDAGNVGRSTNSCGCLQVEVARALVSNFDRASSNRRKKSCIGWPHGLFKVIGQYKGGAKSRGLTFNLTTEMCFSLTQQPCIHCGRPPHNVAKPASRYAKDFVYTGIDRVDNTRGYEPDNVEPCCFMCNRAKLAMPAKAFADWKADICATLLAQAGITREQLDALRKEV